MVTPFEVTIEGFSKRAVAVLGKGTMARQVRFPLSEEGVALDWTEVTPYPALPYKVTLGFLRDGRLRLRAPIEVRITEEEGQTIAEAEELNEFGVGYNQTEAIVDLQYTIAELYFTLEEDQHRLGRELQEVWETLQAKIDKR